MFTAVTNAAYHYHLASDLWVLALAVSWAVSITVMVKDRKYHPGK